ncbi:RING-H2 finger protein ATL2-like [Typha latifolia]|uniref:RING-H2 finger protein ATL2-like n=1 Tax=Typha latifolia TaxID=4733 RepID=UPI003C2F231D
MAIDQVVVKTGMDELLSPTNVDTVFSAVVVFFLLYLYVRWLLVNRTTRSGRLCRLLFSGEPDGDTPPPPPEAAGSRAVHAKVFGGGEVECGVCLNGMKEGEKVAELPRCGHRFHGLCIRVWFRTHDTCPLCRSAVDVAAAGAPALAAPALIDV